MTKETLESVKESITGPHHFHASESKQEEIRELAKDPEMARAMCKQDGGVLQYLEHPSEELIRIAVQKTPEALKYVSRQTPEICMAAVQANGKALQFVKKKTAELRLAAVTQDPMVYLHIRKTTPEIDNAARRFWHYGSGDGEYVNMRRLYGNAKEVLAYMREDVNQRCAELVEIGEGIDYATNPRANNSWYGGFYACICLMDSHIDFEAYPENEVIDLTKEEEA